MKILITNDDGINSLGIRILGEILAPLHEVWIVAPDGDRSGRSHSITIKEPVKIEKTGERSFSCGGSPADCVLYSFLGALPIKPDIVIAGINVGPNLGTDIIYSGTAAAARQGALMGYPAIAVSSAQFTPPFSFETGAKFILNNLSLFLKLWNPDHFININIPLDSPNEINISVTHPSRRIYSDSMLSFSAPNNAKYYFINGSLIEAELEPGSDWEAINKGNISISPIYLHPINEKNNLDYHNAKYRKKL